MCPPVFRVLSLSAAMLIGAVGCNEKKDAESVTPEQVASSTEGEAAATTDEAAPEGETATSAPTPTARADAPDDFKSLAQATLQALGKKDFDGFVKSSMASRDQLRAQVMRLFDSCEGLEVGDEEKAAAEEMIGQYDPASEAVKSNFDECARAHDFSKAEYVSAGSREHEEMCGQERADHVEVKTKLGGEEVIIVLDDLIKSDAGWLIVDGGVSCE